MMTMIKTMMPTSHVQITVKQMKQTAIKATLMMTLIMRHWTTPTTTQMMITMMAMMITWQGVKKQNWLWNTHHVHKRYSFDFLPVCKSKLLIKKSHMTGHITRYNVPSKTKQYDHWMLLTFRYYMYVTGSVA